MENTKQYRVLEILFRALHGEDISVQRLANEYNVSTKSIKTAGSLHKGSVFRRFYRFRNSFCTAYTPDTATA